MPSFRQMKNAQPLECQAPGGGARQLPDLPRTKVQRDTTDSAFDQIDELEEGKRRTADRIR